jgi:REP element-mobilizing transposase RayT
MTFLNANGKIVLEEWRKTPSLRDYCHTDVCAIMPDHFHGLLYLSSPPVRPAQPDVRLKTRSLGAIVGQLKAMVTKRIREVAGKPSMTVWQRNYHDHIIRDAQELARVRTYIRNNPMNW